MSSSTWRVLSGYATYQRTPMRMTSWGKWAPLKLIAIVLLPHDGPLVMEGDHTAKGLKGKLATKPTKAPGSKQVHVGCTRPMLKAAAGNPRRPRNLRHTRHHSADRGRGNGTHRLQVD